MDLETPNFQFKPTSDERPKIPEPLPVRLIAVADVSSLAAAGLERELDNFYIARLGFERDLEAAEQTIVYRSENFRLILDVVEPPVTRDTLRPIAIEIRSLVELEAQLVIDEIEFTKQKGIIPGQITFLLQDPAGNWGRDLRTPRDRLNAFHTSHRNACSAANPSSA